VGLGPHSRQVALALALLGCGERPISIDDEPTGTTGIELGTDTDTGLDTGLPTCDPVQCAEDCAQEFSECSEPFAGNCISELTCECMQARPCPPCMEADCGPFENCTSEFGLCSFACYTSVPLEFDPPRSCQVSLAGYSVWALPYLGVQVDGEEIARVEDCAAELDVGLAWTLLPGDEAFELCEQACLAAANVGADILLNCPPD
jgi:hypothetical protein